MNMQVLDARRDASGGYKVDVSRGQRIGRVSSEWFSRPDDEQFLSLGDLARRHGVSEATIYNWRAKYDGLEVSEARRLRELENENAKLKRLLADTMLDNVALTRRAA